MDTRAYRLRWPRSTLIFDVSPAEASLEASRMLEGVGAKVPRNCMVYHIPSAIADLQEMLHGKGFNGGRPSIWILQGLPLDTLVEFQEFLSVISAMAMEGCMFLGELPIQLLETDPDDESDVIKRLNHTFMSHGFRVDIIDYNEIGMKMHGCPLPVIHDSILFIARQLRLSDDQMEKWRKEFQKIEEEGDEEGFEDMIV